MHLFYTIESVHAHTSCKRNCSCHNEWTMPVEAILGIDNPLRVDLYSQSYYIFCSLFLLMVLFCLAAALPGIKYQQLKWYTVNCDGLLDGLYKD